MSYFIEVSVNVKDIRIDDSCTQNLLTLIENIQFADGSTSSSIDIINKPAAYH